MYKRGNLPTAKPKGKKNEKNRRRNVIMNFRVTPEEKRKIESRIELSGLNKQDYFIQSLMNQQVICFGNILMFSALEERLFDIEQSIQNLQESVVDEDVLISLRSILELYVGLKNASEGTNHA